MIPELGHLILILALAVTLVQGVLPLVGAQVGRADWMGFVLDNDVDYAEYVHYAGAPASPALWETLLPATVATYAPGLLAALRTEAAATQRRIADNQRQGGRGLLAVLQRVIRPATAAFKVGP